MTEVSANRFRQHLKREVDRAIAEHRPIRVPPLAGQRRRRPRRRRLAIDRGDPGDQPGARPGGEHPQRRRRAAGERDFPCRAGLVSWEVVLSCAAVKDSQEARPVGLRPQAERLLRILSEDPYRQP